MKLSARNQLKGKVVGLEKGAVNGVVKLQLSEDLVISAVITNASIQELGLEEGKDAYAIIKASNVMIGIDE